MTGGFTTYCGTCAPGHFNVNGYQVADDVDLGRGRHQIPSGFNLIRIQNNTISGFDENGTPTWNGSLRAWEWRISCWGDERLPADQPDTRRPAAMGDELLRAGQLQALQALHLQLSACAGNRRLPTPISTGAAIPSASGLPGGPRFSTVHPTAPPGLFFPGDPGIPAANWNGHLANFAPRVGLVWNPSGDGKDTLRIGGAILYDS
jgi:hypothetical protein